MDSRSLFSPEKLITRDQLEALLDLENPGIRERYQRWDKGDCSLQGLGKLVLFQCALQAAVQDKFYSDWAPLFTQIDAVNPQV